MSSAERTSEAPPSLATGLAKERVRFRPKTIVPENVEELLDDLWQRQGDFPQFTPCGKCDAPLPLKEVAFTWPVGPYGFYFPGVPAYHCQSCSKTYFPEPVREALASCVERELEIRPPGPPQKNPLAVAFSQRYSKG